MAQLHEPTSVELLTAEGERRAADGASHFTQADFDDHIATYRAFLRWGVIFVAHVAVILIGLAIFVL